MTLAFDHLTANLMVRLIAHEVGNLLNNFDILGTFRSRLMGQAKSCHVSASAWWSSAAPDSETYTACVSFCVVSGTLHAVLLSLDLDVDEACCYVCLSSCGQEAAMLSVVISLHPAAQKVTFSTQPRRSTKRVSWSRVPPVCQHRSIFASTLAYMEQSSAELRAHINWLMRECPRIRDYTRASRSLCRCAIKIDIYLLTYCQTEHVTLRPWTWSS